MKFPECTGRNCGTALKWFIKVLISLVMAIESYRKGDLMYVKASMSTRKTEYDRAIAGVNLSRSLGR